MVKPLEMTRPYGRALLNDPKARAHALEALTEAQLLQRQFKHETPRDAFVRLLDDKDIHAQLQSLSRELKGLKHRANRRQRRRWLLIVIGGAAILALNPWTGPRLRARSSSLLGRPDASEDDYGFTDSSAGGSDDLRRKDEAVATIEQSIDVNVPLSTAYNQWTQFEEFPRFMDGVDSVRQIDGTHLRWKVAIGGREHEYDAEITEQHPDERIAWRATDGTPNGGVVTFHHIDAETTRIMVQMDYQPDGVVEKVGGIVGVDERRVGADLERFKEMIEARGTETGAWRESVGH